MTFARPGRLAGFVPTFPDTSPGNDVIGLDGSRAAWIGGDVGFSCSSGGVSYWLFGDSYIARRGTWVRVAGGGGIVGNTIAVSSTASGVFSLTYYWGGTASTRRGFFDDPLNAQLGTRFSGLKPFFYNGRLYCFLVRRQVRTGEPVGNVLARVNNPTAPPPSWQVDYLTVTSAGRSVGIPGFGNEAFIDGEALVIYGAISGKVIAVRVALAAVEKTPPGGNLFQTGQVHYRTQANDWKVGYLGADALDIKIPSTAGFTTSPNSLIGRWQAVFTDTRLGRGFPPYASIMLAEGPFGPWTEPKILGYFPEMTSSQPRRYHPDNACYAIYSIPDYSPDPDRIVAAVYTVGSRSAFARDMTRQLQTPSVYNIAFSTFTNPFAV